MDAKARAKVRAQAVADRDKAASFFWFCAVMASKPVWCASKAL